MPYSRFAPFGLCLAFGLLAACSGQTVKDTLGLNRSVPDEYRVVSRPPLSVPPDFELRPPMPGESEVVVPPSDRLARSLVTGESPSSSNRPPAANTGGPMVDTAVKPVEVAPAQSQGDAQFLTNAGADKADPAIREKVYEDKLEDRRKADAWYENLNPLGKSNKEKEIVDPAKEAARLRQENVPVNGPPPGAAPPSSPSPPVSIPPDADAAPADGTITVAPSSHPDASSP